MKCGALIFIALVSASVVDNLSATNVHYIMRNLKTVTVKKTAFAFAYGESETPDWYVATIGAVGPGQVVGWAWQNQQGSPGPFASMRQVVTLWEGNCAEKCCFDVENKMNVNILSSASAACSLCASAEKKFCFKESPSPYLPDDWRGKDIAMIIQEDGSVIQVQSIASDGTVTKFDGTVIPPGSPVVYD